MASETPVPEMDWTRGRVVPRVLLASGVEFPKQVPLLDSHNRFTTVNQIGSVVPRKENGEVGGTLRFSSVAEDDWIKTREGHQDSVSVGFEVLRETYVPSGETRNIQGREYRGPLNLATKWRLLEVSIVPIGADVQAKMRGLDLQTITRSEKKMATEITVGLQEELRAFLEEQDRSDEEIRAWWNEKLKDDGEPEPKKEQKETRKSGPIDPPGEEIPDIPEAILRMLEEREKKKREKRRAWKSDVDGMIELAEVEDIIVDRSALYQIEPNGEDYGAEERAEVFKAIKAAKKKRAEETTLYGMPNVKPLQQQAAEHGRQAMTSAVLRRCLSMLGASEERQVELAGERAKGWEDFENFSLSRIARECLYFDGVDRRTLDLMNDHQIAQAAMGFGRNAANMWRSNRHILDGTRASDPAYHVTGSFANLTLDAINKGLRMGYQEAPSTWRGPMAEGPPAADFKDLHRITFGDVQDLQTWTDNDDPAVAALRDTKETYRVDAKALQIEFSWQLVINDDMRALSRVPAQLGQAAARSVNRAAWAALTANPTMEDGQVLFLETATGNRFRSNYTVGATTPTVASLGGMREKMRLMRGLNLPGEGGAQIESNAILNLTPRYLVGPASIETEITQITLSTADPAASGNAGVANLPRVYGYIPIIEPNLDADSATAFYLFADPMQIDTIEVTFLQGQQTPMVNTFTNEKRMSRGYTIVQSFGARALDFRGIQKHKGAA